MREKISNMNVKVEALDRALAYTREMYANVHIRKMYSVADTSRIKTLRFGESNKYSSQCLINAKLVYSDILENIAPKKKSELYKAKLKYGNNFEELTPDICFFRQTVGGEPFIVGEVGPSNAKVMK